MRIFVVDDDPMNRKYLRALLTHEGHAVFECEDGLAALDRLKIELCDAIISDVLMPRMDGYRLCHEIRNNKILAAIPVILFSATYLSTADEKAALAMGADKFLRKPALPEAVVAALNEVAGTAHRRRATQSKKIEDLSALREYSEVLVRKLEETNMQLAAANNALRESEERLRLAATAGNIGMWEWTPATDNLVWSDQQKLILGSPPDAAALKLDWFLNAIVAEDRPQVQAALQDVVANRADYEIEYRVRWPDKSVHWISSKGRGEYDEGGRCTRVVGAALDMTRRKEADELRQRHLERVRALNEISFAVTSTMNRQRQLEVLLEKIERFFPYPTVSTLRLFDQETERLESLAQRGLDDEAWLKREFGRTLHRALRVVETRAPVIVADIRRDAMENNQPMPSSFGLASYAGVPMIARDKVIGVLGVYSKEYHEFNADEVEFLVTVAGHAAVAIQNAQLFEEVDRSRKELEVTNLSLEKSLKQLESLYTSLAPLAPKSSNQEILQSILDRILEATHADAAVIRLWDAASKNYSIVGQKGYPEIYFQQLGKVPPGGAVDWVVRHGEPIVAPDVASDARFQSKTQLVYGFHSSAILPLSSQDDVSGVLHISSRRAGEFDQGNQAHLMAIARQMTIVLENRRLFDSLKASRDDLEKSNSALTESNRMLVALHAVAAAASQSTDLDRVLERVIETITGIFDFEAARIHLYDEKNDEIVRRAAFEKHPERFAGTLSFKKGQGIVGKVIESGARFIFDDITTDPRYLQLSRTHIASRFDHRFFAVFPIRTKTRIFGALGCLGSAARRLTDAEIQLLEALTDQLAVAIENNKLYEDISLKVAELQRKTTEL
ncbi:MAG TPA: GAF domain-containing protein, partial [Verrucomicrobiae bacterium]|nr:GAF domain-containing protein [Verrucomicrobiae bacterium]